MQYTRAVAGDASYRVPRPETHRTAEDADLSRQGTQGSSSSTSATAAAAPSPTTGSSCAMPRNSTWTSTSPRRRNGQGCPRRHSAGTDLGRILRVGRWTQ
jgi:hypothetical protein